jgi:hypothetical protein
MRITMTVHVAGSVHCHCRSMHQHVSPITKLAGASDGFLITVRLDADENLRNI